MDQWRDARVRTLSEDGPLYFCLEPAKPAPKLRPSGIETEREGVCGGRGGHPRPPSLVERERERETEREGVGDPLLRPRPGPQRGCGGARRPGTAPCRRQAGRGPVRARKKVGAALDVPAEVFMGSWPRALWRISARLGLLRGAMTSEASAARCRLQLRWPFPPRSPQGGKETVSKHSSITEIRFSCLVAYRLFAKSQTVEALGSRGGSDIEFPTLSSETLYPAVSPASPKVPTP